MNAITFHNDTKVFTLRTLHSVYQMQVGEYNTLIHLYYGADVGDSEITHQIIRLDHGFSGNPNEAEQDRTFSLDVLPQEYAAEGNGDYRICSIEAEQEDGSHALYLQYESHRILPGKYAIPEQPAMFGTEEEAQTLEIILCDRVSGLKVMLLYGVYPEKDIITRSVKVSNEGAVSVLLRKVLSAQLDFLGKDMDLIHFHGKHAMEREMERTPLQHGSFSIGSKRGASSHQHNPFVILCDRDTEETHGDCYGLGLVYSGNFLCEVEADQYQQSRINLGIHPEHFAFRLEVGESFDAPEVVMAYSEQGFERLSQIYHDGYRENLIRSKYVTSPRPILVNNWEATYFQFDEEKIFHIAKEAKEIGLDMLVLDDGWFGKRNDDNSGLGDWIVNEEKLKGGLAKLTDKIHEIGLKFGLWIEPEMVSEDSDLYRTHPDWCLKIPGRPVNRSRYQLNLDVSRPEVRDHVLDQIFHVIDTCNVDYIKWDMNRSLANVYSAALPARRQGEVYHRYVLGVYDMMERLVSRYPNLLFENCSGGGGRFDAGMLYYSPQIWCSDNTDAVDRLKIQYGTSFGYPISTMGAHVSVCPNHQTGRTVTFAARGMVASAGTFGYELDLEKMSEEDKEEAKQQIIEYRGMEALLQQGDYFRLTNPYKNQDYTAWQFVSKDQKESVVCGILLRCDANSTVRILKIRGLAGDGHYKDLATGRIYTGAALMKAGIPLPILPGDYQPFKFHFVAV